MKTVYLVRHGESEANVRNYAYGDEQSPLTEKGRVQAERIAERCARLKFDLIIVSTMLRAQQTAEAIVKKSPVLVETSELFNERKCPTVLANNNRYEDPLLLIRNDWLASFYTKSVPVEDGDNFESILERAGHALTYLEKKSEQNILVVAHGFILRTILARILIGDSMTPQQLQRWMLRVRIKNTGISVLQYDSDGTETFDNMPMQGWSLRTWNDQAHLG